jgi:hypothetical protein
VLRNSHGRLLVLGEDEWLGIPGLAPGIWKPLRAEKLSRRMTPLSPLIQFSSKIFLFASPYVIDLRYSTNLSLQNLKGHFSKIEDTKIFHLGDMIFAHSSPKRKGSKSNMNNSH